ncbi:hypothetical protein BDZ94DRAFT_801857 [Collybia nuda]|uniref:Uncharacterized protein n=1 Tax=Collybia nuda TaxID=64659 RepID=A0A9P5XRP7_9AGAR|nr:hypothetical protein BDZ94DRAFT_801857 [Collybia nuda]
MDDRDASDNEDEEGSEIASGEELSDIEIITPKYQNYRHVASPPVTPSPSKKQGVKRVAKYVESSDDNISAILESPKKLKVTPKQHKDAISTSSPSKTKSSRQEVSNKSRSQVKNNLVVEIPSRKKRIGTTHHVTQPVTYLEDLEPQTQIPGTEKCHVFNPESEDLLLKGSYDKLVNLPGGKSITTWKATVDNENQMNNQVQFVLFSTVQSYFPNAPMAEYKKLLLFSGNKAINFANLSRINPALLSYRIPSPTYKSSYICYHGAVHPARLLIMGLVVGDRTGEPFQLPGPKKLWMKSLTICPFSLEFERNVTVTCMVAGVDTFIGQISDNELTFSTRQAPLDDTKFPSNSQSSPGKGGRMPLLAKGSSMVKVPTGISGRQVSVHGPFDEIPIFNGCGKEIKLPTGLQTIANDFSAFNGPVPQDSLVLVCYTNGGFMRGGDFCMSHNIVWAIVLETPDVDW